MKLVAKLADAASMFWQSLEPRERAMVGYFAAWLFVTVAASAVRRDRDRIKRELLEELAVGSRV